MAVTACSGNDGGEDSGTVSGDLTLSISKTVIEANGTDAVTVAVMKGETDITSQSKVYMEDHSGLKKLLSALLLKVTMCFMHIMKV